MTSSEKRSRSSENKERPYNSQQYQHQQPQQKENHSSEHQGTQARSDPNMREAARQHRKGSGAHHSEHEERSQSLTERYQHRVEQASSVWLSGILNGHSYAPRPKKVDEAALSDTAKEELLRKRTYTIPRGYKYHKDDLPPILNQVPQKGFRTALMIHMIFFGIAFVFTLAAACPIPWYRGRNVDAGGINYKDRLFSLWKAEGGSYAVVWVHQMKGCPLEKQFYQAIAVSTIVGCVLSLLSLLTSGVRLAGHISYGWILLFSFLAFAWTLCGNAMSISFYYSSRCKAPRFSNTALLDAGFALSLLAWVFQLAGLLVIVLVTKVNVGPVLKQLRVMDTYYMALLCVSLLFLCVTNTGTVWKRRFNTRDVNVVRVTYWHTELIMPNGTSLYYGRGDYRCSAYSKRMKASISFLILSSIALFMAIMLAIPAFLARGCRIASIVFSVITLVFLIISWVTAVAVLHGNSCTGAVTGTMYQDYPGVPSGIQNGLTNFPRYSLQEGVVFSIVSWVIVLCATVFNLRVPWL
ncbi:hypothetical protein, unknown function [Leishmania mexicana MHOM/GT/2001/U1103]|uniref:Amastin-like protein n=1 Tax=Leishmania mexicana (strain MHOM/GT/2001/U1103) TaxID=929439 RepID=E9AZT1_LEIMU|nr:hypothetical protein, unknown function [Leishmania mexicana MHOM/GT/2001/U1103]CBZ28482.1 hypothetical protein, unknown function [Leishmania mexicana MHOM/GT/2001/U1103]